MAFIKNKNDGLCYGPYIKKETRDELDNHINALVQWVLSKYSDTTLPGIFNYIITKIFIKYLHRTGIRYAKIAMITGVLENVKQEFYRRAASPYENVKITEEGDVGYEEFGSCKGLNEKRDCED
jgi:hypothetical protein